MENNMGYNDRMTRAVIAMVIGGICLMQNITGPFAVFLLSIAEILLITSSLSYCPLYRVAKLITIKN